MLSEGKKENIRKQIEYAYDLGSQVPHEIVRVMSTPEEVMKYSGGGLVKRAIRDMEKAIGNRKEWGTKREEIAYILGHLIEEGYVESYEAAAEVAEHMSDDWLYSVLYE